MNARHREPSLDDTGRVLEKAAKGLNKYRRLITAFLGTTPEEIKITLEALKGYTPGRLREALEAYRELHPSEFPVQTAHV